MYKVLNGDQVQYHIALISHKWIYNVWYATKMCCYTEIKNEEFNVPGHIVSIHFALFSSPLSFTETHPASSLLRKKLKVQWQPLR